MSAIDPNAPAFPNAQRLFNNDTQSWVVHSVGGMPIRLWLAGQALAHFGSDYAPRGKVDDDAKIHAETIGRHALNIADGLIAAYNRKEPA